MATLKDIRRRITSVEKTQKITRAMRMVAGAKLRRAQEAIEAGRPYADQMRRVLAEVSRSQGAEHPLLETREERSKLAVVAVTSNRGLCGAFNLNVGKAADAAIAERKGSSVTILSAGRKGRDRYRRYQPACQVMLRSCIGRRGLRHGVSRSHLSWLIHH